MSEQVIVSLEKLGALACKLREEAGDSQEDAAEKLEISQPQVSRAENGVRKYRRTVIRLVELYSDWEVVYPAFYLRPRSEE
jgi:transcriptional regulator with XRE-family HTH domain